MDLNLIINNTLTELKDQGYVEKIVRKQLEETIQDIIKDSFKSWSDFGKELKQQVQDQIQFNLDSLDIPSYNQVILNIIKDELERSVHEEGARRIQESIRDILGTAKEEYKLSELINEIVEQDCELNELHYDDYKEITVIVENKYGGKYIYIDPEEDQDWYRCKYRLTLDNDLTITRAEINDRAFDNKTIMGGLYGADATIFKMWTRKSKLIIDNYQTSFTNPEYE
ncbi:hypothetical protein [Bacillus licheniformis]|uniref:hypothetical protein n=1 Tax=Bacillus licheniformis TaxID=1402 RepID=UPI000925C6BF|nr:hypothetical protein [Bacillus licheniformis]OJT57631.1 hypothetical protein BFP47_13165 [Bacillus licheniformis]